MNHITNHWEYFTVISAICIILLTVLRKKLFEDKFSFISVGFISFISMGIFYLLAACYFYCKNKIQINKDLKNKKLIFIATLAGFFGVLGVIAKLKANQMVKNVAYMRTLLDTIIIISTFIASILFLSAKFKFMPFIGILITISGIWVMLKFQ